MKMFFVGLSGGMYSGSTTHLNLQLGPLQLPPRGYGHTYQMADCKFNCQMVDCKFIVKLFFVSRLPIKNLMGRFLFASLSRLS